MEQFYGQVPKSGGIALVKGVGMDTGRLSCHSESGREEREAGHARSFLSLVAALRTAEAQSRHPGGWLALVEPSDPERARG